MQHLSMQGCDGERSGGGRAMAMEAAVFLVVVVVVDFDFTGGARAWTRQARWYLPCGEAVCVVCHEFAACVCVLITPVVHGHGRGKRFGTCLVW